MSNAYQTEAAFPRSDLLGASTAVAESKWVVMKFGGTSVSTVERWKTISNLVRNRRASGYEVLVVHSALRGVTNTLQKILHSPADLPATADVQTLVEQHNNLATSLGLDAGDILGATFATLDQLLDKRRTTGRKNAALNVAILAIGETLATKLGAAYLASLNIPTRWVDAKDLLQAEKPAQSAGSRAYTSASCNFDFDPELGDKLSSAVTVTQGFIASNENGETVLLGRGGSDTSAAYLAARLQANRLEIWTDVPGMFTADPRLVPAARVLEELHFDEAQELASAGSSVLHPRSISPAKRSGIPLFVRCTSDPESAGTLVSSKTIHDEAHVKGIALQDKVTLISMEGISMWQVVGFLAQVFECFDRNGVSVNLVSTSESNVTVSIDSTDQTFDAEIEASLVADLERLCRVRVIRNCAALSLVGRKIRTILPRLGPALEILAKERVHLMCQAANDLNLSFVVDSNQGSRILASLHDVLLNDVV